MPHLDTLSCLKILGVLPKYYQVKVINFTSMCHIVI